jgi:hypothetical protein
MSIAGHWEKITTFCILNGNSLKVSDLGRCESIIMKRMHKLVLYKNKSMKKSQINMRRRCSRHGRASDGGRLAR